MEARTGGDHPSLPEFRAALIPGPDDDQWDRGELSRAVLHLEAQSALRECPVLLRLACVARRSLDETEESRAVALREVLLELLPKDLDDPCCRVLRVLAGLEPGTAGRGREQRQQVAGSRIGTERQPATSRTVRRFTRQRCWPWLLDRLIEREVQERKAAAADRSSLPEPARDMPPSPHPASTPGLLEPPPATYGRIAPVHADVAWTMAAAQMLWMPGGGWADDPLAYHVTPALAQPAEEWGRPEDDVRRRTFLIGVPAAFLFARARLWQPLVSRLEAATLDIGALDELAAAVARGKRLHDRLGSRAVQGLVIEHVRLATDLLRGIPPPALRPRLARIASEAALEGGLVYCDQREFAAARSYYRLAADLAHEAGDPLLEAFALGSSSRNLFTAVGDTAGGVSLLERAHTLVEGSISLVTEAYLAAAEAEAQADLGDADACLRALDRLDRALDRSDGSEDLPWLYWFGPGMIAGWKGQSCRRVGRLGDAEALLATALSTWDPSFVRDRAITLIDLASVRLRQAELDECCRVAGEALEVAVATASPRLVQRVRKLRGELPAGSRSAGVKVLDEQLATAFCV